jgi:hypothetical protein
MAVAPLQIACGSDDGSQANEKFREVEIQSLAAYECMPKGLRQELRALERRHDARVQALARAALPKGATAGATPPAGFEQTVEADPVRDRLLRRARAIYRSYSPGGDDYDAGCYLREREEARARIEGSGAGGSSGSTGPAGTTN